MGTPTRQTTTNNLMVHNIIIMLLSAILDLRLRSSVVCARIKDN